MRNSDWPFPVTTSSIPKAALYAGAAAGLFLLYKLMTTGVRGTTAAVTRGVIDAGAGVVIGAGEAVGIPQTNQDQCVEAIYAGRTWDASFACPAGTFLRYIGGVVPPRTGETTETIMTEPRPDWAAGLSGPRLVKMSAPARRRIARRVANRNC